MTNGVASSQIGVDILENIQLPTPNSKTRQNSLAQEGTYWRVIEGGGPWRIELDFN
jgi:hypothetical protein